VSAVSDETTILPDADKPEPGFLGRVLRSAAIGWGRWKRAAQTDFPPLHQHAVFVAVAVLVVALVCVGLFIFDAEIERLARRVPAPVVLFFKLFTELGQSVWMIVVALIASVTLAATKWAQQPRPVRLHKAALHGHVTFFLAVIVISGLLARLMKGMIGRARPNSSLSEGALHFEPLAFSHDFAIFPSGHATTFGAACMVLACYAPTWRWPLFVLAIAGAASRVIVGWHYASDVIAGAAFGAFIALLAARFWARRNTLFKVPEGCFVPVRRDHSRAAKPRSRSAIRSSASSNPT